MTGSTRETQFKNWFFRNIEKTSFQKINSEGLPDFYCFSLDLFFEVKYREHGPLVPRWYLFSSKQKIFIVNNKNKVIIGYRTGFIPWGLYKLKKNMFKEIKLK